MSRRRRIAIALAIGSLMSFGLLELVLRVVFVDDGVLLGGRPLPPFGATTNPEQREWVARWREGLRTDEPYDGAAEFRMDLGWSMRPSAREGSVRTNALGARGSREYPPRPPNGTLRIACFGDSFTWCDEVDYEESWPYRVEFATENVEAINFGVGGYGTDQAWLRYRADGRDLGAHVVVIGIMLEDIGRNVNRYRPWYYPVTPVAFAKPRFRLDERDHLVLVPLPFRSFGDYLDSIADGTVLDSLREHEHWFGPRPFGAGLVTVRLASAPFAYAARDHAHLWLDRSSEPYRVTLAILEAFHHEAIADGARLAPVVVFPTRDDLASRISSGRSYWQGGLDALRSRGVPTLDVTEALVAACGIEGPDPDRVFAGGHLDALGNEIVARTILDWLERELPQVGNTPVIGRRY
ncbi:MAG: hypothetical protein KDB80_12550 [Planctomycetes bacterium]|nr:hypothetical protein [Planctomycetota bacterium]